MGIMMGQVTAPTSPATIKVCTVPPGSTIVINTVSSTADVFLGTSASVTAATGSPLDSGGPTRFDNPRTSSPFDIWCCAGTGTHVVGFIVITTE